LMALTEENQPGLLYDLKQSPCQSSEARSLTYTGLVASESMATDPSTSCYLQPESFHSFLVSPSFGAENYEDLSQLPLSYNEFAPPTFLPSSGRGRSLILSDCNDRSTGSQPELHDETIYTPFLTFSDAGEGIEIPPATHSQYPIPQSLPTCANSTFLSDWSMG
jgi:hypothetical protein